MTRKLCLLLIFTLVLITLFANDLPTRLANLPYMQNFDGPDFPADWTQTTTVGPLDRWVPYESNFVGGDPYELYCFMTPGAGITRLISPQLNTAGIPALTVQFLHYVNFYDLGLVFKLQYSHDLVNWYNTTWSISTPGIGIHGGLVRVTIENLNAPVTYISWTLEGDQMGMEGAVLDNIRIHLPVTELDTPVVLISEGAMISWDAVPDAVSYDIYIADDPYGEFSFETNVEDIFWQPTTTDARKFYQVIAIY